MKVVGLICLSLLGVMASGCGSQDVGPSDKRISKAIQVELPGFLELNELNIEASENVGSEVEPIVRTRFSGALRLREPLYQVERTILGKSVLSEVVSQGEEVKLFGVSTAELQQEQWRVEFDDIDLSPKLAGESLGSFRTGEFVFAGSTEEAALINEYEREQALVQERERERLAQQKAAEAERREIQRLDEQKRRQAFRSFLANNGAATGAAGDNSESWPFRMKVSQFVESDNSFTGQMEWPTLNGITRIEGTLIDGTLVFTEKEHIKRGNVALGTVYEFSKLENGRVEGRWNRRDLNWAWFSLPD